MAEDSEAAYNVQYLDGKCEEVNWIARAGRAIVTYPNGDRYEGMFNAARQKHGRGKYSWNFNVEGTVKTATYEGNYKNGKRDGYGVCTYDSGEVYEGLWKNDKRSGDGTYRFANGDIYSGSWKDDMKHGHGAYVFKETNCQLSGDWENGTIVRGKWIMSDLSSYHGNFSGGKPIGKGVFIHSSGNLQEGKYAVEGEDSEGDEDHDILPRHFIGGNIAPLKCKPEDVLYSAPSRPPVPDFIIPRSGQRESKEVEEDKAKLSTLFVHLCGIQAPEEEESEELTLEERLLNHKDKKISIEAVAQLLAERGEEDDTFKYIVGKAPSFSNPETWVECLQIVDNDHDGSLDWSELQELFFLAKLFHMVDTDESGQVKHCELLTAMREHQDAFPTGFVEGDATRTGASARLTVGDEDGDRMLTFSEFCKMTMFLVQLKE